MLHEIEIVKGSQIKVLIYTFAEVLATLEGKLQAHHTKALGAVTEGMLTEFTAWHCSTS